jgi:glutamate-5-semialdehyde dehydrogenase
MRRDMVDGLRAWRDAEAPRGRVLERVRPSRLVRRAGDGAAGRHRLRLRGPPNVFADATGVIRAGNTVVFRIGSDALGTARAIVAHALDPALAEAGLPEGSAVLVDSAAHAAGWAMFADARLSLAVARGSGPRRGPAGRHRAAGRHARQPARHGRRLDGRRRGRRRRALLRRRPTTPSTARSATRSTPAASSTAAPPS